MSAHPPPVPPDQRSPHGGGDQSKADVTSAGAQPHGPGNPDEQGQAGNTKVNTTNKGLQHDR